MQRRTCNQAGLNRSDMQVHHRVTEVTERRTYLFVYREIPIDENSLQSHMSRRVRFENQISKAMNRVYVCQIIQHRGF
jgi:hypothetical protein